jgi:hypothetical protein
MRVHIFIGTQVTRVSPTVGTNQQITLRSISRSKKSSTPASFLSCFLLLYTYNIDTELSRFQRARDDTQASKQVASADESMTFVPSSFLTFINIQRYTLSRHYTYATMTQVAPTLHHGPFFPK